MCLSTHTAARVIYKSNCDCLDEKPMVYKDFFTKVMRLVTKVDATRLDFTTVSATGFVSTISFLLTVVARELSAATLSFLRMAHFLDLMQKIAHNGPVALRNDM